MIELSLSNIVDAGILELRIDSVSFALRFQWLERLSRWSVDFLREDGSVLAGGVLFRPNFQLNRFNDGGELPEGVFFLRRTDRSSKPIGRYEIQDACQLLFISSDELDQEQIPLPNFVPVP